MLIQWLLLVESLSVLVLWDKESRTAAWWPRLLRVLPRRAPRRPVRLRVLPRRAPGHQVRWGWVRLMAFNRQCLSYVPV